MLLTLTNTLIVADEFVFKRIDSAKFTRPLKQNRGFDYSGYVTQDQKSGNDVVNVKSTLL